MKKIIFILIGLLALSAALGLIILKSRRSAGDTLSPTTLAAETKTYTIEGIANHSTRNDCWMAIDGKVYDVTNYIPMHPGGAMILQGCGKDASNLFNSQSGSGTSHSGKARMMLQRYLIGDLK